VLATAVPAAEQISAKRICADLSDAILEDTVLTGAQAVTSTIWPTDFNMQRRRDLGVIEVGDNNLA